MTSARENSHGNGAGLPRVPSIPLSDDADAAADQSIGGLVKDATAHFSTLVRGELELAKTEVAGEVKKALTGSVSFILALVLLLLFIPFGLVALALGINDTFDWENHPWWGFLIVFVLALLGAGFDTMSFRLRDSLAGIPVFVVDHPATQAGVARAQERDLL